MRKGQTSYNLWLESPKGLFPALLRQSMGNSTILGGRDWASRQCRHRGIGASRECRHRGIGASRQCRHRGTGASRECRLRGMGARRWKHDLTISL